LVSPIGQRVRVVQRLLVDALTDPDVVARTNAKSKNIVLAWFTNIIELKVWDNDFGIAQRVGTKALSSYQVLLVGDAFRNAYVQFAMGVNDGAYLASKAVEAFTTADTEANTVAKYDELVAADESGVVLEIRKNVFGRLYTRDGAALPVPANLGTVGTHVRTKETGVPGARVFQCEVATPGGVFAFLSEQESLRQKIKRANKPASLQPF